MTKWSKDKYNKKKLILNNKVVYYVFIWYSNFLINRTYNEFT